LLLALACFGAEDAGQFEESSKTSRPVKAAEETEAPAAFEIHRNIVIAAGKSVVLESELDFSSSDKVMVTFRCTTCDSQSNSMANMQASAAWSVPRADSFSATEMKAGSTFPYFDSGGVVFQVYGPQFRLILRNKGAQAMIVQQVTVFRRLP
jgi:hypothetical protein